MQGTKKNVILRVFQTAHCSPGKYVFGVICSALSVLLSGVPFYTVYRIIRLFLIASLEGMPGPAADELWSLAAASERRLLVFDEPTSGLDGFNMRLTIKLLKRLAEKSCCILLITHDMELIAEAADNVLYLEKGKVRYHRNIQR